MTPSQFKDALRELGISQRQFAREIEVDVTTVNRWANGKAEITGPAKAYLNLRVRLAHVVR
jgi:DNA-binding transcriptional regulator YiaG